MTFDVINYTYSGLISIFSMIMGMAYPLVHTAITEIDAKYGGNRMSEKVLSDSIYIRFRAILAISIVASILTPFVLYYLKGLSDWKFYWVLLQTIVVLLLVLASIQLYDLIIRYKLPKRFFEYYTKNKGGRKDIIAFAEIARYAARHNDSELYLQCTAEVGSKMSNEINNGRTHSTLTPFYSNKNESILTNETKEALAIYTSIICDSNIKDGWYRGDCSLLNLYFFTTRSLLGGDRLIIWKTVQEAARNGNDEFVKQYWVYAVQYYSLFDLSRNIFGADVERRRELVHEKEVFHKFHTALLGMLLYLDRKKCLTELLYYSHSFPYSYPLCCNSLQTIFDEWKIFFQGGNSIKLLTQLQDFPLVGNEHGVDSEWFLLHVVERILAIQIIRLKGIDYNVAYCEPLADILDGKDIEEKRQNISLLERIKVCITEIFDERLESILGYHVYFDKKGALQLIDKQIQRIASEIREKDENPSIDSEKLDALVKQLHKAWNDAKLNLGTSKNIISDKTECYERVIPFDIPKEMVCTGYRYTDMPGFVTSLISALVIEVKRVKAYAFKKVSPVVNYRIEYQNIGLALQRLRLSSGYVILYNSIDFDLYYTHYKQYKGYMVNTDGKGFIDEALLKEQLCPAVNSYMIILKRDDLPYLTIDSTKEGDNCDRYLEIDIDTNCTDKESLSRRYIKTIVELHYPKELRYIRIDIPNVLGDMDINKIGSIDYLLS